MTDINVLAKRRLQAANKTSGNQVNVHLDGLANIIHELRNEPRTPLANRSKRTVTPASAPKRSRPPPKMDLADFCAMQGLSEAIAEKLAKMDVDGPHLLCKITDQQLADGGLSVGQVAAVRDGEERYLVDAAEDP